MKTNYRIIKVNHISGKTYYKVQRKRFGLFWEDAIEWSSGDSYGVIQFSTVKEAEQYVKNGFSHYSETILS